jgi:predicted nucleic acid-binding protein
MTVLQYLLDTDWTISYLSGHGETVRRLDELLPEGVGLSIISLAELYEGWQADDQQLTVFDRLANGIEILPLTDPVCRIFGQERRRLRAEGNIISDLDLFIGATAICHELVLLTNNHAHFSRMSGIRLIGAE